MIEQKTYGRTCTPHEIEQYVALSPHTKSACPNTTDILKFLSASSESPTPVVIYAGCNKADDFINAVRVWSRNEKYSIETMYKWMESLDIARFACGQDSEVLLSTLPPATLPVMGYCIEPMLTTVNMVQSVFQEFGYIQPEVNLVHAAASNYPGKAEFPIAPKLGTAGLGLHDALTGNFNTTTVQVITLDDLVRKEKISKIDYLSIDTEGNDMQVLLGAIGLLSSHSIRFFEFEHHTVARWITSSLRDLIELVDSMGYDCYWTMNSGKLARLTGCWNDAYLFKRWSNVACISRRDSKGHDFMESLAAL